MITFKNAAVMLALLGMLGSPSVRAEITSGSFSNQFSGSLGLWDPSGTYTEDLEGINMSYTMYADPGGKLTGSGTFHFDEGWDYLDGDFNLSGTMKSAGNVVRLKISMTLVGTGSIEGYFVNFSAKVKEDFEIDELSREMTGTVSGSVTVGVPELRKKKSQSIPKSETSVDLPDDAGETWTLLADLTPVGNTYIGTATAELSSGRTFDLSVTGTYTAKKNTSKLLLKGISKSVSLSLVTSETNGVVNIQSMKGSTLGQKIQTGK